MTKIAVLSPQPRTSGVVTYSHHLAKGFRKLGHEADVVTFTLSGKPSAAFDTRSKDAKGVVRSGWGWSALGYDVCARWDEADAVLSMYDVIVVEEPRCAPLDKRAMRAEGEGDIKKGREEVRLRDFPRHMLPPYIKALASLVGKKIAITLHDPGYGFRLAPFLEYFMDEVSPDLVVTHRDGSLASAQWAFTEYQPKEVRIPHLPYEPAGPRPREEKMSRVVGMTGRYINNKGQPTLALAAALDYLSRGWTVEIAGASPLGAGPNHTFLTFEGLTTLYGYSGHRDGADVTRGWPWDAAKKDSRGTSRVRYVGPYDDPLAACSRLGVHVNATDGAFSGVGSIEYSTLEAMDAGCLVVIPKTAVPEVGAPEAHTFKIEKLANAELSPVDEARRATADNLGVALADAADVLCQDGYAEDLAKENYSVIDEYHDPARYARALLEAL